jgi:N-formylglutamate amidohydrolase
VNSGSLEIFKLKRGDGPLLVNVPHAGTRLPAGLADRLQGPGPGLPDTDWYVDELYDFAPDLGAGLLVATHSRYLIDLNRPPDDTALYATHGTGLVPLETFAGEPLYAPQSEPGPEEIAERVATYWQPYHQAIVNELNFIRERHGFAVLLDGHSIRSRVPLLFDGRLPDLNLGSNGGQSAHRGLIDSAMAVLGSIGTWTSILDGRFQGGYITRHYGRPDQGIHALQLEMAQSMYMQESPPARDRQGMQDLSLLLARLVGALLEWRPGPT